MIAWGAADLANPTTQLGHLRTEFPAGLGGAVVRVNSCVYGVNTRAISAVGGDICRWTSLDRMVRREACMGSSWHEEWFAVGGEFRVNTTTVSFK